MATNWMNEMYGRTCAALATLTAATTINWFEIDMNQDKKEGEDIPRLYPACFFKFHDVIWTESGATSAQLGIVKMEMKVIHEITDDSQLMSYQVNGRSDETRRNIDLQSIFTAMNNLSGSTFNPLRRITNKEEFNNENLQVINTSQYFCNVMSDNSTPPSTLSIDYNYLARMDTLLKANKCCQ